MVLPSSCQKNSRKTPFYLAFQASPTFFSPSLHPPGWQFVPTMSLLNFPRTPAPSDPPSRAGAGQSLHSGPASPRILCLPVLCHGCPVTSASRLQGTCQAECWVPSLFRGPTDSDPLISHLLLTSNPFPPVTITTAFPSFQVSVYSPHSQDDIIPLFSMKKI